MDTFYTGSLTPTSGNGYNDTNNNVNNVTEISNKNYADDEMFKMSDAYGYRVYLDDTTISQKEV